MEAGFNEERRIYPTRVDRSGRVSVPAELREALGLNAGSRAHWIKDENGLRIATPEDALRDLQDYFKALAPADRILSEELIAERRAEALRE